MTQERDFFPSWDSHTTVQHTHPTNGHWTWSSLPQGTFPLPSCVNWWVGEHRDFCLSDICWGGDGWLMEAHAQLMAGATWMFRSNNLHLLALVTSIHLQTLDPAQNTHPWVNWTTCGHSLYFISISVFMKYFTVKEWIKTRLQWLHRLENDWIRNIQCQYFKDNVNIFIDY